MTSFTGRASTPSTCTSGSAGGFCSQLQVSDSSSQATEIPWGMRTKVTHLLRRLLLCVSRRKHPGRSLSATGRCSGLVCGLKQRLLCWMSVKVAAEPGRPVQELTAAEQGFHSSFAALSTGCAYVAQKGCDRSAQFADLPDLLSCSHRICLIVHICLIVLRASGPLRRSQSRAWA